MSGKIEVWIIHKEKRVLVTDIHGAPPRAVCGYVSEEARQAAEARGYPTVSEIGFDTNALHTFAFWDEAIAWAKVEAKTHGYRVDIADSEDIDDDGYDDCWPYVLGEPE
jgi:hypothetical protein